MKRLILIVLVLAAAAGCGMNDKTIKESRLEAEQRWSNTRARMLCGVGNEHLKVGQLDKAGAKAMEALALDKDYAEARILLGKVLIEQGAYPTAAIELEKVCQSKPRMQEPLYLLAVAQEKGGQREQALDNYRKAHALDTNNLAPMIAATEVLVQLGRVAEARSYFDNYVGLAGNDPAMYELAGRLAAITKDYPKAASYFQQAHDLDVNNVRYYESLGQALFLSGKYRQASETLGDLVVLKDYKPTAAIYCLLGDSLLADDKVRDARDAYLKASELQPRNAEIWVSLGRAALAMRDPVRAAICARTALSLDNNNHDALSVLGYALIKQGKSASAIKVLSGAVANHPKSTVLLCVLGRAYNAAGEKAKARQCYQQAVELEPQNELAKGLLVASAAKP